MREGVLSAESCRAIGTMSAAGFAGAAALRIGAAERREIMTRLVQTIDRLSDGEEVLRRNTDPLNPDTDRDRLFHE